MVILLTGASGFLGRHIVSALSPAHTFITLGRAQGSTIQSNLASGVPVIDRPVDCVVHAAGKAHVVPRTPAESEEFFTVNLQGTRNLCLGLEKAPSLPKFFVFISTVAVYGVEEGQLIAESHPLNGDSPYAKSKIQAEAFLQEWCAARKINLTILRLPLIAGSNPPGNLGAMIKGIKSGKYFNIAGGAARKSVVHADDVARLIPRLADTNGAYNLTDGQHPSFAELAASICHQLGKPAPKNLPGLVAGLMACVGNLLGSKAPINSSKLRKITSTLTFDDRKARTEIQWAPSKVLDSFMI